MAHRMLIFRQFGTQMPQTAALPLLITQRIASGFAFDPLR
jgi:hypothetical protein